MSKQEEMYNLVTEYRSSGISAKAFSKEKGLSPTSFGYWVRKKIEEDHPGVFVEVGTAWKSSARELELSYPNGVKLQMGSQDRPGIGCQFS